ncbi:MAG: hypothetical protein OQK05_04885 [Pseudopelagicola sp.]|nr:hypothetical protein [Pseudopelagicola sp.]
MRCPYAKLGSYAAASHARAVGKTVGGGALHGDGNHGLTDSGRAVVQAVVDRGLILDIAHSSPKRPCHDRHPGVASHTGIRIAAPGGVIGIGYWSM